MHRFYFNVLWALVTLIPSSRADLIPWGDFWNAETSNGMTTIGDVQISISTSPSVNALETDPILLLQKTSGATQSYAINFSEPVSFDLGFSHLNSGSESVRNFSVPPDGTLLGTNHTWDGAILGTSSTNTSTISTLSWDNIVAVSFDHRFTSSQSVIGLPAAQFTPVAASVPEPSTYALFGFIILGIGFAQNRKKNRHTCLARL